MSAVSPRDKQLLLAIVGFLDGLSSRASAAESSQLGAASASIRSAFTLVEAELAPADGSAVDALEAIFASGCGAPAAAVSSAGGGEAPLPKFSDPSKNAVFVKYVDAITRKGFFNAFEKGSPEYAERLSTAVEKFCGKFGVTVVDTATEDAAAACKARGNAEMKAKRFDSAIKCYAEALALSPSGPQSHIYYCNRAAAQHHLKRFDEAADDSRHCIRLQPDYAKGHSRLGVALLQTGDLEGAADALQRCLELDPSNGVARSALTRVEAAQQRGAGGSALGATAPGLPNPSAGGMPDLSAMMAAMGGGAGAGGAPGAGLGGLASLLGGMGGADGAGGADGLGGLAGLMQSPQMQSMAANMMQNPQVCVWVHAAGAFSTQAHAPPPLPPPSSFLLHARAVHADGAEYDVRRWWRRHARSQRNGGDDGWRRWGGRRWYQRADDRGPQLKRRRTCLVAPYLHTTRNS